MIKTGSLYTVKLTSSFKKSLKLIQKQGKNIDNIKYIVKELSNGKRLKCKYKNHKLVNNKKYKNCYECHIEPDWLLVYKYNHKELILLLVDPGSHSDLL